MSSLRDFNRLAILTSLANPPTMYKSTDEVEPADSCRLLTIAKALRTWNGVAATMALLFARVSYFSLIVIRHEGRIYDDVALLSVSSFLLGNELDSQHLMLGEDIC